MSSSAISQTLFILSLMILKIFSHEESNTSIVQEILSEVQLNLMEILDDSSEFARRKLHEKKRLQDTIPDDTPFPCDLTNARSKYRPEYVNEVRPGDIDVIAAVGDSFTAGMGAAATNIFQSAKFYREVSWAIGGQGTWREYLTLPNILKMFNSKLVGYSKTSDDQDLNFGLRGMTVRDLPLLFQELVKQMNEDTRIDIKNDWKLITVMLGTNDFCNHFCHYGDNLNTTDQICKQFIMMGLDYLRQNLPRTIVNLVPPLGLQELYRLSRPGFCRTMQILQCPCLFGEARTNTEGEDFIMQKKWQQIQEEVASDERYRGFDFAVVAQPFLMNSSMMTYDDDGEEVLDMSLVAEDCFHFSQRSHARAAIALWNNMLEPIGQKTQQWPEMFDRFLCPTKDYPYIFAYDNSPNTTIDLRSFPLIRRG